MVDIVNDKILNLRMFEKYKSTFSSKIGFLALWRDNDIPLETIILGANYYSSLVLLEIIKREMMCELSFPLRVSNTCGRFPKIPTSRWWCHVTSVRRRPQHPNFHNPVPTNLLPKLLVGLYFFFYVRDVICLFPQPKEAECSCCWWWHPPPHTCTIH